MITEDYVSYETAKLLKEKGFNEHCHTWQRENENINYCDILLDYNEMFLDEYLVPTLQMAMKWLREVYNFHISVTIGCDTDNSNYIFYWAGIAKFSNNSVSYIDPFEEEEFNTNEEACEAAIKYCLENLI